MVAGVKSTNVDVRPLGGCNKWLRIKEMLLVRRNAESRDVVTPVHPAERTCGGVEGSRLNMSLKNNLY